jgi:hypothetical protein
VSRNSRYDSMKGLVYCSNDRIRVSQRIGMKTMAQMKVGSTGMFVGRTTTDCRFENKVGSEMLHIAYRKPEWQWDTEVDAAEKSMVKG